MDASIAATSAYPGISKAAERGRMEMSQSRSELESKAIISAQQHICEFMKKVIVLICQSLMTRLFLIIYFSFFNVLKKTQDNIN